MAEEAVLPRVASEAAAAAMLDNASGLQQQQAAVRLDGVHAPAHHLASQAVVILLGVVAEQREAEAILALKGAMARARIAARPAKQTDDMPLEVDFLK